MDRLHKIHFMKRKATWRIYMVPEREETCCEVASLAQAQAISPQTLCTIPILVEFDRSMSVSLSSILAADVDMRASSRRGIVEVESEPSWVASFIDRMDQRLDANERRIEQVLGLHQTRLDKHDAELSSQRQLLEDLRSEIGLLRRTGVEQSRQFGDLSSDTTSTAGSSNSFSLAEWCSRTVLVRGWAPFGSPASQKIDPIEYKKVANELLSCLPHCLQNNVVVRAPSAANSQISFGMKDGGGWDSCRAVREPLIAGVESNMINVRGHSLKVSIELPPRRKITLSNMFRAESFLKKSGVNSESLDLGETPKGSNVWVWHREKCSGCGVPLSGWEDFKS